MADELQMIKMELEASELSQESSIYEEFYENIEAPKFVDFTAPNHYIPDDKYWFCHRLGCDQKHEEEMDSEAIHKNFVLRVMAARSPNIRLQKALNKNALSKTMKCPLSAPPKFSKHRASKLAHISSLCGKLADKKGDVTKPQQKLSSSTPKSKTKQVDAKYLTTPRNRKSIHNEASFRSVQHPKIERTTASKDRTFVKALVFYSPKRTITIKTSVELRLSRLRSQKKQAPPLRKGVTFKEENSEKVRSGSQTEKAKIVSSGSPKNSTKRVAEKGPKLTLTDQKPRETNGEDIASCTLKPLSTGNSELMSLDVSRELENPSNPKPMVMEGNDLPRSQMPHNEETPQSVGIESEVTNIDDKENSLAMDANRCLDDICSETRSKVMPNGPGKLKKTVQGVYKIMKDGIISIKVKKTKPTHPKPFRFRTDERGILKEAANMEKKVHIVASKTEPAKPFLEGKIKKKLVKHIQGNKKLPDKCNSEIMPERTILGEVTSEETIAVAQEGLESAAAMPDKLMQVRKMRSPLKREVARPEREAKSSLLVPAQRLKIIKETSSPATRPRKTLNKKENRAVAANNGATTTGHQPSQKRTLTIPKEPTFHAVHRSKSCTKQVV